jgi:hypothetical protein
MVSRWACIVWLVSLFTVGTTTLSAEQPKAKPAEANPEVEPGLVPWHADFAAACAAAKSSGKPVLLFQMMGRLDQQFC